VPKRPLAITRDARSGTTYRGYLPIAGEVDRDADGAPVGVMAAFSPGSALPPDARPCDPVVVWKRTGEGA
jgi:hypothetical protein